MSLIQKRRERFFYCFDEQLTSDVLLVYYTYEYFSLFCTFSPVEH